MPKKKSTSKKKTTASKKKAKGYKDLTIFEQGKLHSLKGSLIEKDMKKRIAKADAKVGVKKLVAKKAAARKKAAAKKKKK
jgi:hypothetical protein